MTYRVELGALEKYQAWWDVPLPPCVDCGGEIVWEENGYTPGTRGCCACRSLFFVGTEEGNVYLERLTSHTADGAEWHKIRGEYVEADA